MTYAQCIEARRLLGLSQVQLAAATTVSSKLINAFENTGHLPRTKDGRDRVARLGAFFEKAGLAFTSDVPAGVRLRQPDP